MSARLRNDYRSDGAEFDDFGSSPAPWKINTKEDIGGMSLFIEAADGTNVGTLYVGPETTSGQLNRDYANAAFIVNAHDMRDHLERVIGHVESLLALPGVSALAGSTLDFIQEDLTSARETLDEIEEAQDKREFL